MSNQSTPDKPSENAQQVQAIVAELTAMAARAKTVAHMLDEHSNYEHSAAHAAAEALADARDEAALNWHDM